MSGTLWIVLMMAVAMLVWASVVFIVPACLRSMFRYRLWKIRDDVVDLVAAGDVPRDEARRLVKRIDVTIHNSRDLTLLKVMIAHWAVSRDLERSEILGREERYTDPTLRACDEAWTRASVRHVLFGTPSGWIATAVAALVLVPMALISALAPRHRDRDGKTEGFEKLREDLREEVEVAEGFWATRREVRHEVLV